MILPALRKILILGVFLISATAQAGTVTATLGWPINSGTVIININNGDTTAAGSAYNFSGLIPWTQTPSGNHPALSNLFYSFCIELTQDVYIGSTHTFTLKSLQDAPDLGPSPTKTQTEGSPPAQGMGMVKAGAIERLWHGYYSQLNPISPTTQDLVNAAAFQLAIWRIEYDWTGNQTLAGATALEDFTSGNFRANSSTSTSALAALAISGAQSLLGSVLGGSGNYGIAATNLVAMTDPSLQDQVTQTTGSGGPNPHTPEPTSMCLALIGGLALSVAGYRRRRAVPQGS